jgi:hypothetical protein
VLSQGVLELQNRVIKYETMACKQGIAIDAAPVASGP